MAPAEIRNEKEDNSTKKLVTKIKIDKPALHNFLLGAKLVNGKWYWDSDLTHEGTPIGTSTQFEDLNGITGKAGDAGDCLILRDDIAGQKWVRGNCKQDAILCEAKMITATSVNLHNISFGSRDYTEL